MPASKTTVETMLASLRTNPLHLSKLKKLVTENMEKRKNMNDQLHLIKGRYYELKQQFENITSRSELVEHVQKLQGIDSTTIPTLDAAAIEKALSKQKDKMKQLKSELRLSKTQLKELIAKVSTDFEKLIEKEKQFNESKIGGKVDPARLARWRENKACYGYCEESQLPLDTEAQCSEVLSGQEQAIQELTVEAQTAEDSLMSLEQQLRRAVERVSKVKGDSKGSATNVTEPDTQADTQAMASQKSRVEALQASIAQLHGLTGTKADVHEGKMGVEISIEFQISALRGAQKPARPFIFSATLNDDGETFGSAQLLPAGEPVADILALAVRRTDLGFVVRELQNRVRCSSLFRAQLEAAPVKASAAADFTRQVHAITAQVGEFAVSVSFPFDFPCLSRTFALASVATQSGPIQAEAFDTIVAALRSWASSTKGWTMAQWFDKFALIAKDVITVKQPEPASEPAKEVAEAKMEVAEPAKEVAEAKMEVAEAKMEVC